MRTAPAAGTFDEAQPSRNFAGILKTHIAGIVPDALDKLRTLRHQVIPYIISVLEKLTEGNSRACDNLA